MYIYIYILYMNSCNRWKLLATLRLSIQASKYQSSWAQDLHPPHLHLHPCHQLHLQWAVVKPFPLETPVDPPTLVGKVRWVRPVQPVVPQDVVLGSPVAWRLPKEEKEIQHHTGEAPSHGPPAFLPGRTWARLSGVDPAWRIQPLQGPGHLRRWYGRCPGVPSCPRHWHLERCFGRRRWRCPRALRGPGGHVFYCFFWGNFIKFPILYIYIYLFIYLFYTFITFCGVLVFDSVSRLALLRLARSTSPTTLSPTIFHTPHCHPPSFTHHIVTHHLSHTTLSPTIFHTPLCHPPSFTHHIQIGQPTRFCEVSVHFA